MESMLPYDISRQNETFLLWCREVFLNSCAAPLGELPSIGADFAGAKKAISHTYTTNF